MPNFQGVDFKNLPLWKLFFSKGLTIGLLCRIYSGSSWLPVEGDSTSSHSWGQPASHTLHLRVRPCAQRTHLTLPLTLTATALVCPQPSCYHSYLHKELKFLLTLAFFFQSGNKAWAEDRFDEMARKTAFLHWRFENIALVFWDPFVLLPPSIFALWLLAAAALSLCVVLPHSDSVAARPGLVSLIYYT